MDENRSTTCFFTGHRFISNEKMTAVTSAVDGAVEALIDEGFTDFVCGGAVGFDTIAACRVIAAKKRHPQISLILVLPCRNQTAKWRSSYAIALYQRIKGLADRVVYATDVYDPDCMYLRNRMMADMSSVCVAYYSGGSGGTAYTVRYATESGIRIINLYE